MMFWQLFLVLVEAANIDEVFEEREKNIISTIIQKQFSISNIKLINKTIDKVKVRVLQKVVI